MSFCYLIVTLLHFSPLSSGKKCGRLLILTISFWNKKLIILFHMIVHVSSKCFNSSQPYILEKLNRLFGQSLKSSKHKIVSTVDIPGINQNEEKRELHAQSLHCRVINVQGQHSFQKKNSFLKKHCVKTRKCVQSVKPSYLFMPK